MYRHDILRIKYATGASMATPVVQNGSAIPIPMYRVSLVWVSTTKVAVVRLAPCNDIYHTSCKKRRRRLQASNIIRLKSTAPCIHVGTSLRNQSPTIDYGATPARCGFSTDSSPKKGCCNDRGINQWLYIWRLIN